MRKSFVTKTSITWTYYHSKTLPKSLALFRNSRNASKNLSSPTTKKVDGHQRRGSEPNKGKRKGKYARGGDHARRPRRFYDVRPDALPWSPRSACPPLLFVARDLGTSGISRWITTLINRCAVGSTVLLPYFTMSIFSTRA